MNVDFFKTWSPDMAWLLGYIWADGCIYPDRYHLSFYCVTKDDELLEYAKRILCSHHVLRRNVQRKPFNGYIPSPVSRLVICCKSMVADLINIHGVFPGKSRMDLEFPQVPDRFLSHFVRGYFDGDGCVTRGSNRLGKYPVVAIYGSTPIFLNGMTDRISRVAKVGRHAVCVHKSRHDCCVEWAGKKDIKKLFSWMYSDGSVPCLKRKLELFRRAAA